MPKQQTGWGAICLECLDDTPDVVGTCWCPAPGPYGWVCPECAGKAFDAANRKCAEFPVLMEPAKHEPKPLPKATLLAKLWAGLVVLWWEITS